MSKIEEIYKQAEAGSPAAQYELAGYFGEMSRKFTDREKVDYCLEQVLIWLEKAADQGYKPAQQALEGIRKKYGITGPEQVRAQQAARPAAQETAPVQADGEQFAPAFGEETEDADAPYDDDSDGGLLDDENSDTAFDLPEADEGRLPQAPHEDTIPLPELPPEQAPRRENRPVQRSGRDVPRQPRAWVPDAEEEAFFKSAGVDSDLENTRPYIPRSAAAKPQKKRTKESRLVIAVAGVLCVVLLVFGIVQVAKLFKNSSRPGNVPVDSSAETSGETSGENSAEKPQVGGDTSADTSGDTGTGTEPDTSAEPQTPTYDLSGCDYLQVKPESFLPESEIDTYRVNSEDGLRMRAGPGTEYDTLASIANGTALQALAKNGSWIFVKYSNQYGWMLTDYMVHAN